MKSQLECNAAFRKHLQEQERISTDPEWVRRQMAAQTCSRTFCIAMACILALALMGIVVAVGSI